MCTSAVLVLKSITSRSIVHTDVRARMLSNIVYATSEKLTLGERFRNVRRITSSEFKLQLGLISNSIQRRNRGGDEITNLRLVRQSRIQRSGSVVSDTTSKVRLWQKNVTDFSAAIESPLYACDVK